MKNFIEKSGKLFTLIFLSTLIILFISSMIGGTGFILLPAIKGTGASRTILLDVRLPRVIMGSLAGAALAAGGVSFQAIFRNPLATPFTLGISSGAAFGAVLAIKFGFTMSFFGLSGLALPACAGAAVSAFLVFALSRSRPDLPGEALLLAGVAVNFFFSAMILMLQYISDFTQSFHTIRWLMGGLSTLGYNEISVLFPFALVAPLTAWHLRHELNLILSGDEVAQGRGVDVKKIKKIIFISVSISVGAVTAFCGPIGFVGMMIPHICRMITGGDHGRLIPVSILAGAAFLTSCDTLARTMIYPAEIPVGVITSLLGGPFFLWLLIRKKN